MKQERIRALIEIVAIFFLYFHTFWHLIYFERSTTLVFGNFFLLTGFLMYCFTVRWPGFRVFGLRVDNAKSAFGTLVWPMLVLFLIYAVVAYFTRISFKIPKTVTIFEFFV